MGKKVAEEPAAGAPMWLLSFGDMMTNVLCFFILLVAFASDPSAGHISDGITSIRAALGASGRPGALSGDELPMDIGEGRALYRPSKSIYPAQLVDKNGEISDGNRDALRKVLIEALESPGTSEIPVPLVFAPGSAELTKEHRAVLKEVVPRLASGRFRIRAEGFAWREGMTASAAWRLANQRAENVISYLQDLGDISRERLLAVGYGSSDATNSGEFGSPQDRWGRRIVILRVEAP